MSELHAVRAAVADVLAPGCFFVAGPARLHWQHLATDETPWEVSRGRLAARRFCCAMATFETWNVFLEQGSQLSAEPLLSLKLDRSSGQLHIVRGIWCWIWEGYQAEGEANVFLSREVPSWVREWVGTLDVASCDVECLRKELASAILRAVVGLSRLPLTSVEAPLPGFSLGEMAYFFHDDCARPAPMASWSELLDHFQDAWPVDVKTRWLEFLLRCVPVGALADAAAAIVHNHQKPAGLLALLRAVFNDVALSPYTDFVDKTLIFLRQLVQQQFLCALEQVDFLGRLLRQLARHLTAYDLVTFHHRGANYPDALLLDSALKEYLRLVEQHAVLFEGDDRPARLRRRGLRLAWLHRRRYEGHPIPDAPTSPGENARILPPPHERVPEEQILNLGKRKKRLYDGDPLPNHLGPNGQRILGECGRDLLQAQELRELGTATFIERPLGWAKVPGEPDLSPLLAHEGFSRSLAERALSELGRDPLLGLSPAGLSTCRQLLTQACPVDGLLANTLPSDPQRIVSLADAAKAANDFVIIRTLPASVRAFAKDPDGAVLLLKHGILLSESETWLVVAHTTAAGKPGIMIRDVVGNRQWQLRLE